MTEYAKLLPQPTPDTQPYWDGLKAGTLRLQRCAACGKVRHYPRPVCEACWSMDCDWIDASGRGGQMFRTAFTYPLGWRSQQQ